MKRLFWSLCAISADAGRRAERMFRRMTRAGCSLWHFWLATP